MFFSFKSCSLDRPVTEEIKESSKFCLSIFIVVVIAITLIIRIRYGGGTADFPDRTATPVFQFSEMEKVADLDLPPGNIAVSSDGRIFFSLHPEARPDIRVAELIDGKVVGHQTSVVVQCNNGISSST